jgi:hypothetical protein
MTQSTHWYGSLKVIMNVPADLPTAASPGMRSFRDFLLSVNRTTARNKLDPSVKDLASPDVVKYVQTFVIPGAAEGVGSMTYTIGQIQTTGKSGYAVITGCLDQSDVAQVRKNGSRYVDPKAKKYPTLKMTAGVSPGLPERRVTLFTFAAGAC